MVENFRTNLKDTWNLRALTYTETGSDMYGHAQSDLAKGTPREQGHY